MPAALHVAMDFGRGEAGFREKGAHVVAVDPLGAQAVFCQLLKNAVGQRLFSRGGQAGEPENEGGNFLFAEANALPEPLVEEIEPILAKTSSSPTVRARAILPVKI